MLRKCMHFEIVHNGHSRLSKMVDFGTHRKHICNFLSVINSNCGFYLAPFQRYCKTLYFRRILISRFYTSIYQAFGGQTEFSQIFNFTIFSYSRNSQKFDAREKYVFYSIAGFLRRATPIPPKFWSVPRGLDCLC